jgi:hypothetical protein
LVSEENNEHHQRLVVLRAVRMVTRDQTLGENLTRSPPLALQAAWTTARGVSP